MAKRRQLNKRFVILLVSIGAILVLLAITAIIALQPRDPDRMAQRARKLLEEGEYAQAARHYGVAANESRKPEYYLAFAQALLKWREDDPTLGQAQRSKLFFEARGAFREALRWNPQYVEAQRQLTEMELLIARGTGNWQQYVAEADKLLELVPEDHEVLFMRASAKAQMAGSRPEYIEPALEDFRALLERAPGEGKYWLGLARFYAVRDKKAEAEKTFKEALQAIPDSLEVRVAYSSYLLRLDPDRKAEARQLLSDAVAKQPDKVDGYLALSDFHQGQKQYDQAIQNLEKARSVDVADHRVYVRLAYLHRLQGDPDKAEATLLKGLEEIRKSLDESEGPLPPEELASYRTGIIALDHVLCDVLLDRVRQGEPAADIRPRVEKALQEMQGIAADHPFVDKVAGALALADRKYIEAERRLRRAYDRFGVYFDSKTAALLITVYRRLHQLGEAQKIVERYLTYSKEDPGMLLNLAGLYLDYREYDQAQRLIQQVLRLDPDQEIAKALAVGLEIVSGARERLPAEVKKIDRFTARLLLQRAGQLWAEGEEEKAVRLSDDVLAREPRNAAGTIQLIGWLKHRKETDRAQAVLKRALPAFADNPELQKQLEMALAEDPASRMEYQLKVAETISDPVRQAIAKADVYRLYRKEEEYLAQLKAAEAKAPKNPLVVTRLFDYALSKSDLSTAEKYAKIAAENDLDSVQGKFFEARVARGRQQWQEALRLINEAIKIRSRFSEAYAFRGDCYLALEMVDEARADYETAHELNPSNVRALLGMVVVSERAGTPEAHARWVTLAYRFLPTDPRIREKMLELRESEEEPEKVVRQREQIRKAQPGNLDNLSRLASLYEKVGKPVNAEEAYRAMYRISQGKPWTLRALARFLRRTNRDVEARGMLAQYVKTSSDKAVAYLIWAEYLDEAGESEQARVVHRKALEVDTDGRAYASMASFLGRQQKFAEAAEYQKQYLERAGWAANPRIMRTLIYYRIEAGQLKEAQEDLTRILSNAPNDHEALALQGRMYYKQGEYAKAKQSLDKALEINPEFVTGLRYRVKVHLDTGDRAAAVRDLEAAARLGRRGSAWDALQLVQLYDSMGDFGNAYAVLENFLTENPTHATALKARVDLCLKYERWPQLVQALNDGKKAYPKDPFYPEREARMWQGRAQPARGVAPLQAAIQLAGPEKEGELSVRLAWMLAASGRASQAIQMCQTLRARKDVGAQAMAIAGLVYAKQNNHAEAEKHFTAALKAAPAQVLLEVVQRIREAYPSGTAIANLTRWLAIRPDDWQLAFSLAEMLLVDRDHAGALVQYKAALAKAADESVKWQIYGKLGIVCDQLGRYEEARQAYESALKIVPKDGATLNNLAWLIARNLRKPDEALPYAEQAAELLSGNAEVLDTYGLILLLKGDYNKAEDVLVRSIGIKAISANRMHLGNVYEKMDRKQDALRQYDLGWELIKDNPKDPHYEELRKAVERLRGGSR